MTIGTYEQIYMVTLWKYVYIFISHNNLMSNKMCFVGKLQLSRSFTFLAAIFFRKKYYIFSLSI